jgi:uncharacterized membrane protein YeaQ/YmgE (transglycosylase-associated protein family)
MELTTSIPLFIIIGSFAGWLAGKIMKGDGFGLIGNMIVGIIGAVVGVVVFDMLEIYTAGMIGFLITAVAGSIILLLALSIIK